MKGRGVAIGLAVITLVYVAIAGTQAIALISSGELVPILLGVGLLIIPLIGLLLVWRELAFGFHVQAMTEQMQQDPGPLPAQFESLADADAAFVAQKERVEADPQDWRSWYLLAASYDAAKDRKRARAAMRYAYQLFASTR